MTKVHLHTRSDGRGVWELLASADGAPVASASYFLRDCPCCGKRQLVASAVSASEPIAPAAIRQLLTVLEQRAAASHAALTPWAHEAEEAVAWQDVLRDAGYRAVAREWVRNGRRWILWFQKLGR